MKKAFFFKVLILVLFSGNIFSQVNSGFNIFYSRSSYTLETQKLMVGQNNFKQYNLMLQIHIDPKNTGKVDQEVFIRSVKGFFPDSTSSGILCIDLENQAYKNLYNYDINTPEFKEASALFIWMLKKVKEIRPNVKVGFYGIPFREYYTNKKNTSKLDVILSGVDYIFPSLYTMYPDKQIGKSRNEKYLKDNLQVALEFGIRLNKPVVPFVWNIIHPSNKLYGGQLVDKNEMIQNIEFIKKFKYKNTSASGVVWWDPDSKSFSKMNKTKLDIQEQEPKYIQSKLFQNYLDPYIKK
ncbi:hypothetical protein [Flavobacterium sp. LC2016-12]|uniref:hypothetical protein n=1 Tax=Flavobacterium sp. LC2016-12 TaxID=2783794 RepID=UPI00188CF84E|nr:hypothetical protein [Flavobacterium sp. LC2016-12]MBF4465675.1 hypothetical protein [Flavobacterium sp. LC2016-12]